eukprot:5421182-Alexandrium_andersonii.AAC.1
MSCMRAVNSGKKAIGYFQGDDGREKAMKWVRTLRAKAGVFIADEAHGMRAYFIPVPANMAHAEDLVE